jgi:pyrroloquinoline quinone biosynthesis protein D
MSETSADMSATMVITLARGVRLREDPVRKQTILLSPENAMALDDIAIKIVEAFDGVRSLDAIAEDFAAQFDAPKADILADVLAFAGELSNRRLIEVKP